MSGSPEPNNVIAIDGVSANDPSYTAWQYAIQQGWTDDWIKDNQIEPEKSISRKEFAALVDRALDPFKNLPISIVPEGY